jgi:hypothetical protein
MHAAYLKHKPVVDIKRRQQRVTADTVHRVTGGTPEHAARLLALAVGQRVGLRVGVIEHDTAQGAVHAVIEIVECLYEQASEDE